MTAQELTTINQDTDNEMRIKLQNFIKGILHKEPAANEIRVNKMANGSKYVPISYLEMNLDEMFFGLWQTKNFQSLPVANEIVGSIEVHYFHPVAKTWICRIGAGAVMIQQEKGAQITDLNAKYKNTLTKDYPHLKAECFRNACQSIGKAFGRDLNREFNDQYTPIIKEVKNIDELVIQDLKIKLSEFEYKKELVGISMKLREEYIAKGMPKEEVTALINARIDQL